MGAFAREALVWAAVAARRLPRLMSFPLFRRLLGARRCAVAWRRLGAQIDQTAYVGTGVWMRFPEHVTVGAGSRIDRALIDSVGLVTVGENALVNDAALLTASHDVDSVAFDPVISPIVIDDYAWLAKNVTVLPGVVIGRAAVVGTGAVVTRDVMPHRVVAGNPAREVKSRADVAFDYVPASDFGATSR